MHTPLFKESEQAQSSSLPAAGYCSSTGAMDAALTSGYEEQLLDPPDNAISSHLKARIVAHPLFEHLLSTHVACLRLTTPFEEHHILDSARKEGVPHVVAKYQRAMRGPNSHSDSADDSELDSFMAKYVLLLDSFKDQLLDHLRMEASKAILICDEIEHAFLNLTGARSSSMCKQLYTNTSKDNEKKFNDGLCFLGIKPFLNFDLQKYLRFYIQTQLKQELNKDYWEKLKEVHSEILQKKQARCRLPHSKTYVLKEWWKAHEKFPYPTEEEKAQLMEEAGLDAAQVNNWFVNQRKKNLLAIKRTRNHKPTKGDASINRENARIFMLYGESNILSLGHSTNSLDGNTSFDEEPL